MALDSKNNIKSVFIVPDLASASVGTKVIPGSIGTGKVAICDVNNEILPLTGFTNLDYPTIKIIKDRGANLPLQQVRLNYADMIAYSSACYQAADEQISYIGYNGTSGSLTGYTGNLNNIFFIIKLEHVPNAFAYGKRPANYKYGTYQSAATGATQQDIANGLVSSLVQNFKPNRTIDWRVFSEVTTNATRTPAGTGSGTLTFTKYSKTVTPTAAAATAFCTAGTYISIAAGTSNGVYKVASRDTGTGVLTLEIPYNGETVSGVAAGTALTSITVANAGNTSFNWGIKITGIKQKYDVNRWRQYDKVRFNALLENFGATTTVTTTAAFDGVGVYEQAANDEYISWGDEGQIFVDQVPPLFREQDADPNGTYDVAVLGWLNNLPSLIGAGENKGQAILYIEDSCNNQGADILTTLDTWLTSKFDAIQSTCNCG